MDEQNLMDAILRVERMERCFDALQAAASKDLTRVKSDPALNALLQELAWYYDDGQWLKDYEMDEKGLFPADLKRGVLSEDGVYDLLSALAGDRE